MPSRTPPAIVARLNEALQAALRDPEVRAAYARVGADPADPHPPEVFAARAKRDGATKFFNMILVEGVAAPVI